MTVGLQSYEGWTEANYQITKKAISITAYLRTLVESMSLGWEVSFEKKKGFISLLNTSVYLRLV